MRQGDVKRKGADLLVAPLKLNVRLSKCGPRSVEPLRGLVKPRNYKSPPAPKSLRMTCSGLTEPSRGARAVIFFCILYSCSSSSS